MGGKGTSGENNNAYEERAIIVEGPCDPYRWDNNIPRHPLKPKLVARLSRTQPISRTAHTPLKTKSITNSVTHGNRIKYNPIKKCLYIYVYNGISDA